MLEAIEEGSCQESQREKPAQRSSRVSFLKNEGSSFHKRSESQPELDTKQKVFSNSGDLDDLSSEKANLSDRKKTLEVFLKKVDMEIMENILKRDGRAKADFVNKATSAEKLTKSLRENVMKMENKSKLQPMYTNQLWSQKYYCQVLKLASIERKKQSYFTKKQRPSDGGGAVEKKNGDKSPESSKRYLCIETSPVNKENNFLPESKPSGSFMDDRVITDLYQNKQEDGYLEINKSNDYEKGKPSFKSIIVLENEKTIPKKLFISSNREEITHYNKIELLKLPNAKARSRSEGTLKNLLNTRSKIFLPPIKSSKNSFTTQNSSTATNRLRDEQGKIKSSFFENNKSRDSTLNLNLTHKTKDFGLNNQLYSQRDLFGSAEPGYMNPKLKKPIFVKGNLRKIFMGDDFGLYKDKNIQTPNNSMHSGGIDVRKGIRSIILDCIDFSNENRHFIKNLDEPRQKRSQEKINKLNADETVEMLQKKRRIESKLKLNVRT